MLAVIGMMEHVVKHKMMDGITFAQNADVFVSERYFKRGITLSAHFVGYAVIWTLAGFEHLTLLVDNFV